MLELASQLQTAEHVLHVYSDGFSSLGVNVILKEMLTLNN